MLRILELMKEKATGSLDKLEKPQERQVTIVQPEEVALTQAREVARRTRELLFTQGWCLWKCSTLNDEIIAVVRDENVTGVPIDYPVYTEAELEELCQGDISEATLRLVHEAKKLAGAKIVSEDEG